MLSHPICHRPALSVKMAAESRITLARQVLFPWPKRDTATQ
jgi:hypothetical protein